MSKNHPFAPINYTKNKKAKRRQQLSQLPAPFLGSIQVKRVLWHKIIQALRTWVQRVWLPRCLGVFHQLHQHFSVLKTPGGDKKQTTRRHGSSNTPSSHPQPLLHYKSVCPHMYPPKSPPTSNACHDPSKESLQHTNGERHPQSLNRLLTDDVPNLTSYCFITGKETLNFTLTSKMLLATWQKAKGLF